MATGVANKGDPVHPLSTSYALSRLLPTATLHVVADLETAYKQWPYVIKNFCADINRRYDNTGRIAENVASKKSKTFATSSPRTRRFGMAI